MKVLSLDISSANTGWCFTEDFIKFELGAIVPARGVDEVSKLLFFGKTFKGLLKTRMPDAVVIEDSFSGRNIKTLKTLASFGGVAKYVCKETLGFSPYVISNMTVKSYFKVRKKKQLFYFVCSLLKKDLNFSKYNDKVDALAQLLCYSDIVLGEASFREEKDYGFLFYEVTCDE